MNMMDGDTSGTVLVPCPCPLSLPVDEPDGPAGGKTGTPSSRMS